MSTKTYLFVIASPSKEAMLLAYRTARDLGIRVAGQDGTRAMEVFADDRAAAALFTTGLFSTYTKRVVAREHLEAFDPIVALRLRTWNARFSSAYKRRKRDKSKRGRSWADPAFVAPAPPSRFDPSEVISRVLAARKEARESLDRSRLTRALKIDLDVITPDAAKALREHFSHAADSERLTDDLIDTFYRAKKPDRALFLDPAWLKRIIDVLRHMAAAEEPGCLEMHGRNSVGIVFVEATSSKGPKFSSTQRAEIEGEIKSGLSFLVAEHPSGDLVWVYDVQHVKVDVANKANKNEVDPAYDAYWRDPAIGAVTFEGHTFSADSAGIDDYRTAMRAHHSSQHATVVFVSAFGLSWHAYSHGNQFIAMGEHGDDWGNWGQDELNIIMAHEMSHQFGATDEYTGSGTPCSSCGGTHGCDGIPNGNCQECAHTGENCIMHNHDLTVCQYTRGQIGWSDLFVELWTGTDWWSGTDDHVEIDIGDRVFTLDVPNHDDRENGNREGYAIWAGGKLERSSIKRVLIRKSEDGFAGGWLLKRVRVRHAGEDICDVEPNVWLEDRKTWHVAKTFDDSIVNTLKLRVATADESWAGTDDDVTLKLAGRSWNVDSDADDFERGSSRTYDLDPQTGFHRSDIHTITIKKSPDGFAGGWKLKGLKLTVNGSALYDNDHINQWLEDDDRTFSDGV